MLSTARIKFLSPCQSTSEEVRLIPFFPVISLIRLKIGSIIPQVGVRQSIEQGDLNPPCLHVYPGNGESVSISYLLSSALLMMPPQSHSMFLDDGVSRDSAPADLPQYKYSHNSGPTGANVLTNGSCEAKSKYTEVEVKQVSNALAKSLLPFYELVTDK